MLVSCPNLIAFALIGIFLVADAASAQRKVASPSLSSSDDVLRFLDEPYDIMFRCDNLDDRERKEFPFWIPYRSDFDLYINTAKSRIVSRPGMWSPYKEEKPILRVKLKVFKDGEIYFHYITFNRETLELTEFLTTADGQQRWSDRRYKCRRLATGDKRP